MSEFHHLTFEDMNAAMRALARLNAHADATAFPRVAVEALDALVPNELLYYNEFERQQMVRAEAVNPAPPELLGAFASLAHEHPGFSYIERTQDGSARTISDLLPRPRWHRLAVYNEYYRKLGHEDQIWIMIDLVPDAGRIVSFAFNRSRANFTQRERALLNLMRTHVLQAYHNAQAISGLKREASAARGALEALERGVVALRADGRTRWMTPRAAALLAGSRPGRRRAAQELPDELRHWVRRHLERHESVPMARTPLILATGAGSLCVRLVENPGGEGMLLLIEEPGLLHTAPPLPPLPPRLRKVLDRLLTGDSEKQAAARLGLSIHSVHQYVKELHQVLDVNSRAELLARCLGNGHGISSGRGPDDPAVCS